MNSKTLCFIVSLGALVTSYATPVDINIYIDSAPNVYGSPAYAPWWTAAQEAAVDGTFVNMANSSDSTYVGTTQFTIEDVTVYSFGDKGKRLHFVYWVPETTINELQALNFELRLDYVWEGVSAQLYDWSEPTTWTEYEGGVIGTSGFAYWGAYNVNTQEALDSDLAEWDPYAGDITLTARVDGQANTSLIVSHPVPEGGVTLALLGLSSFALAMVRRGAPRNNS